ncbi:glycosyltransferase involved in cell wall biosynthesis [Motilibacter peucedani]|uniref:Glycosyltransferase involved in cell wall biosynthesis n=1 Tax=Motilibacter peucedani TaxID=598650 RepID=A0A420XMB4_9ACTN|nr:glycosyltransferase family 4 protein [Motilibacter peucedani]RKS71471.1 glycosyltransferase involved in cell wall biosynthesis [Motilibacter peucedani]
MRRQGLRAVVRDAPQQLTAALQACGVELVEQVADADLVLSPRALEGSEGRLWLLASDLPGPLELLAAPPGHVAAAAAHARWVVSPDERTRGLLDAGVPDAAKRGVVLPWDAPAEVLQTAVEALLARSFPAHQGAGGRRKLVVAGHALHFLDALLEDWRSDPALEVRVDSVPSFARHDQEVSRALAEWADVVVCEWASPVAAFYSTHKRSGSRLVVRLHRAELYSEWWKAIDIDAVDAVVCVSGHYARLTRETTGWPAEKVTVVPNYVDATVLARHKLPGAEFALGLMGAVPRRKRLDLALDVVERLRSRDPRFTLFVKSRPVWDVPYAWRDEQERAAFDAALHRVRRSPLLADGVVFDAYGSDVGAWLRKIGWMLSTSDDESFHLAPAETMASGGVPVLRDWAGVETIYDPRWVQGDPDAMARTIADAVEAGTWPQLAAEAQGQALARFDVRVVAAEFARLISG